MFLMRRTIQWSVPGFVGLALAGYAWAVATRWESVLLPCPVPMIRIFLAMMGLLLVGIWLPHRFAAHFVELAKRLPVPYQPRRAGVPTASNVSRAQAASEAKEDPFSPSQVDAHLRVIAAGGFVVGGLAILVGSFVLFEPLVRIYHLAIERFHWTVGTSYVLDLLVLSTDIGIPLILIGIGLNSLQRIELLHREYIGTVLGRLTLGAGLGLWIGFHVSFSAGNWLGAVVSLIFLGCGTMLVQSSSIEVESSRQAPVGMNGPALPSQSRWVPMCVLVVMGALWIVYLSANVTWKTASQIWNFCPMQIGAVGVGISVGVRVLRRVQPVRDQSKRPTRFSTPDAILSTNYPAALCGLMSLWVACEIGLGPDRFFLLSSDREGSSSFLGIWCWKMFTATGLGIVGGVSLVSLAQRSTRPVSGILSAMLCAGIGTFLGGIFLMMVEQRMTPYYALLVIVLVCLGAGVLWSMYEPDFHRKQRMGFLTAFGFLLGIELILMPSRAPAWSEQQHEFVEQAGLRMVSIGSTMEAHRDLGLDSGALCWKSLRKDSDGPSLIHTLIGRIRRVWLQRESMAAIMLVRPEQPVKLESLSFPETIWPWIRDELRTDGNLLILPFEIPRDQIAIEQYRDLLQRYFAEVNVRTIQDEATLPDHPVMVLIAKR